MYSRFAASVMVPISATVTAYRNCCSVKQLLPFRETRWEELTAKSEAAAQKKTV